MYISHSFRHPGQLLRACYWLMQSGFDRRRMEIHSDRSPRLALQVDNVGQFVQARMIFDAIETAHDGGALPASWSLSQFLPRAAETGGSASNPIGWHPHELDPPANDHLLDAWDL